MVRAAVGEDALPNVEEVEAEQVLLKVRQKLSGVHDGVQLSVPGHVGTLIQV